MKSVLPRQILETQATLMRAQAEEDAKSGNSASEARRWTGVRTIVEARSLLKSLFRAAAGHKAQVRGISFLRLGCLVQRLPHETLMTLRICMELPKPLLEVAAVEHGSLDRSVIQSAWTSARLAGT